MRIALIVVAATTLAFLERLLALRWYRRWFAQGMVGDMSIHYTIIRTLKHDPRSRWIDQYLIAFEPMSYPTGFHRIAKLFSLRTLRARPYLPNLILWTAAVPVFVLYASYLGTPLGTYRDEFVAVSAVVLLVSTSSVVFRGPAIAYLGLSERLLGRLACSATFVFLVGWRLFGDRLSLVLAIAAGGAAILCSVFARQALIFSLPILSLVWLDVWPVAVLAGSFLVALLVSRDHLFQSMKHTVIQWRIYKTHTKQAGTTFNRAVLSYPVSPRALWKVRHDLRSVAEEIVRREPTRTLLAMPEVTLLIVLLAIAPATTDVGRTVLGPLVAAGVVYALTSTDWLNHLGESYRYLEYELTFVIPLLVAWLLVHCPASTALWSLGLYSVAVAAAVILWVAVIPRFTKAIGDDELSAFMDDIDKPTGTVVFPVPMTFAGDICARYEQCKSFWWQPGMMTVRIFDEFFETYPFLKREFGQLFTKYQVTMVVVDKGSLGLIDWSYDFSSLEPLKENGRYLAYRVPGSPG